MMQAPLIFNELSIKAAATQDQAKAWFSDMIQVIVELFNERVCERTLHSKMDLYAIDLIENEYGFQEWLDEARATDRDLYLFALQLSTNSPVFELLKTQQALNDEYFRSEFVLKNSDIKCEALGVALLSDGIAVSLPSCKDWVDDVVYIEQFLYDETDGELEQPCHIIHQVRHASQVGHTDSFIRHWRYGLLAQIKNSQTLLAYWPDVFPNLDRCEEDWLQALQGETLESTLRRLEQLDNVCKEWQSKKETHPVYPMKARPESKETMRQTELAEKRLSTCPVLGRQHFVMHCDIQPKGFRLYWLENQQQKRMTIGYIGPHLPTIRF